MGANAIETHALSKSYRGNRVLGPVDLAVRAGTIHALLGPNGAGKTTLMSILSTLIEPDGGTASVAGHDVRTGARQVRESIAVAGQAASVDEVLTGRENLVMAGRLLGLGKRAARERAVQVLAAFGLARAADQRVRAYSGGMRRRLDLATSLLVPTPVVFLDEPTTGLDARSRLDLWQVVRDLAVRGATVLLTTQYLEEADQLADMLTLLNHGAIIAQGTPGELKGRLGRQELRAGFGVGQPGDPNPGRTAAAMDGTLGGLRRAVEVLEAQGMPADAEVEVSAPSLDDVFLTLTANLGQGTPRAGDADISIDSRRAS